jgi:STE24 endopeptidase
MIATRMLRIFALAAGGALSVLAAALLWRTEVPADLRLADIDPAEEFSSRQIAETADYARVLRWLWVGSTLAQLAALVVLTWHARRLAARLSRVPIHAGFPLLVVVLAVLWLVRLPFRATAHWWRRKHDISRQGYLDWLTAPWLELLTTAALLWLGLLIAMALARRLGPRWWIAAGPLLALLGAGVILAQPLLLAPRLDPLEDRRLTTEIQELAGGLGVGAVEVDVKDASERTTTPNAEVAGIGPTRRVVLWDTLLDGRFTAGEIRFIAAHELGHVARRHLWKGLGWFALLALPGVYVLAEVTRRRGGIREPAAVPLAVLTVVVLQLALLPATSAISRRYEAEADWVALEVTESPAAARRLLRRFSETSLSQPEPPPWAYALRSTHPSLLERIAMADAWARRRLRGRAAERPRRQSRHGLASASQAMPRDVRAAAALALPLGGSRARPVTPPAFAVVRPQRPVHR